MRLHLQLSRSKNAKECLGGGKYDASEQNSYVKSAIFALGTASTGVRKVAAPMLGSALRPVLEEFRLRRKTLCVIRQNYGIPLAVNTGSILVGALEVINSFVAIAQAMRAVQSLRYFYASATELRVET